MRAIDPIDRIALMEKLGIGKECTVCEQNSDPYCKWKPDVVDVCEAICTAPSIEPERKTGRWIDHAEEGYVECPFCHSATNCDDNISDLHFCFSCGARMEGAE